MDVISENFSFIVLIGLFKSSELFSLRVFSSFFFQCKIPLQFYHREHHSDFSVISPFRFPNCRMLSEAGNRAYDNK